MKNKSVETLRGYLACKSPSLSFFPRSHSRKKAFCEFSGTRISGSGLRVR